jgi:hypothetical protein
MHLQIPKPRILETIVLFVRGFLARDRYLTEALAALTTFATGALASLTLDHIDDRPSLAGFRDMPCPELYVVLAAIPGLYWAIRVWRDGEITEGRISFGVMSSFVVLCGVSLALNLENWAFWSLFCLLLGLMKGYALVREWTYLRWSVTVMGAFFWLNFTISLAGNLPRGAWLLLATPAGFAVANLLSVFRLNGR